MRWQKAHWLQNLNAEQTHHIYVLIVKTFFPPHDCEGFWPEYKHLHKEAEGQHYIQKPSKIPLRCRYKIRRQTYNRTDRQGENTEMYRNSGPKITLIFGYTSLTHCKDRSKQRNDVHVEKQSAVAPNLSRTLAE